MNPAFERDTIPMFDKAFNDIYLSVGQIYMDSLHLHDENYTSDTFRSCIFNYYYWVAEDADKIARWVNEARRMQRTSISNSEYQFLLAFKKRMQRSLDLNDFMHTYSLLPKDVSGPDRVIFEKYANKFKTYLFRLPYED